MEKSTIEEHNYSSGPKNEMRLGTAIKNLGKHCSPTTGGFIRQRYNCLVTLHRKRGRGTEREREILENAALRHIPDATESAKIPDIIG
jgi:hypothetical protein